jgi:ubiquinone/menaquinone biosynthesis C-methylase UbiE
MTWFDLPRQPEPEVMNDQEEVDVYASAAAQAFLDAIDNTLVDQVLSFNPTGILLDIGTGPGGIPLKVAQRCPEIRVVGVDRSANMITAARRAAAEKGLSARASFLVGDACRLAFPSGCFDVVLSNSVLHHLEQPTGLLREMARVAKPEGLILLRDLRRPSRLAFPLHVRWHGRYYSGLMYRLFLDSVRAAYTPEELAGLLGESSLLQAQVFLHKRTHLGFVRDGRRSGETWRVPRA